MATNVTLVTPDPMNGADKLVGSSSAPLQTQAVTSSTGVTTRPATSTTVATLKAANTARKGLTVYNEGTALLYVNLGPGASATNYTYAMPANAYYEVPYGYTGIVTGMLATGSGSAQITELV